MSKEEKILYLPITINKEDWIYWWEAKIYDWCFSEWKTLEEFWQNMLQAIQTYSDWIKEWFFKKSNLWLLAVNIDKNGKIKGTNLKRIDTNPIKVLSWS